MAQVTEWLRECKDGEYAKEVGMSLVLNEAYDEIIRLREELAKADREVRKWSGAGKLGQ